jgi:hypothetical protein
LCTVSVPSSELGPPPPFSLKRVCPSPGSWGGGTYSPAVEGVVWSQFIRPEKKPSRHSVYSVVAGPSPLYLSRTSTSPQCQPNAKFITMLVSSFNLSPSFNYMPYLFYKKRSKSDQFFLYTDNERSAQRRNFSQLFQN